VASQGKKSQDFSKNEVAGPAAFAEAGSNVEPAEGSTEQTGRVGPSNTQATG
jgi:hypothetical protein